VVADDLDPDLLVAPADRLVSLQYVLAALRRKRRLLAALAVAGLLLGSVASLALSKPRTATTVLLLQFPDGADPSRAINTDVSLLQTRAVADAALKSLRLATPVTKFQSSYRSAVLSDSVLRITVKGPDASEAVRRSNAVSQAFLRFRKAVYERQLSVVAGVLTDREDALSKQLAQVNDQIATFDPNEVANSSNLTSDTPLGELLTQRSSLTSDIAELQTAIQDRTIATTTVANGSRVIDPGSPVPLNARKALVINAASGVVAALALGAGGVVLIAVVTTRLRRRADIAAALQAPVLLSVGPVTPPAWLRFVPAWIPAVPSWVPPAPSWKGLEHRAEDLKLVVRHLQSLMTSASTHPPALVVVSVDNVDVAAVTVWSLASRLADQDQHVIVVNETGRALPEIATAPTTTAVEPPAAGDTEPLTAAPSSEPARDSDSDSESDVVVVVAALNPAKGAEHLREWASDAVVLVTAGRSTATTLESNATMIRAAGLHLRSVVLIGSDPDDDSLGTFDSGPSATVETQAGLGARSTSSKATFS
jgi:capsular polysaccharide biosynthesis protein